jgi:hypothetical protein
MGCVTAGGNFAKSTDVTEEVELVVENTIISSAQVTLDPVNLTVSTVKSVVFFSTLDATVVPYNGASAGTSLSLTANVPYIWSTTAVYGTNPFLVAAATTVTLMKVTASTAAAATPCVFTMRALISAAA